MKAPKAKPLDLEQFEGHTPGMYGLHIGEGCISVMRKPDGDLLADVYSDGCSKTIKADAKNAKANGLLFQHAPALLALAKEQREQIKELESAGRKFIAWTNSGTRGFPDEGELEAAIKAMRAALAKEPT